MNQPLLTVIVPCYNVEQYVNKCITSIVGQTYTHLEILLIDDGSTDETGIRCDAWQEKDQRIRVIHKQNEGVAYARKTGVENALAEYVTFVDPDDWIDSKMYTDMMATLLSTNSDIAHCDLCYVYEDGRMVHRVEKYSNTIKVIGRIEGVIMILDSYMWVPSFGTKIFKKFLFDDIEFPKGRWYGEDMILQHLFHQASQTVWIENAYYFYFQRNDSRTNLIDLRTDLKNVSDLSDAYHDRYTFVKQYPEYHSVLENLKKKTFCAGLLSLRNMVVYPQHFTKEYFYLKANQTRSFSFSKKDNLSRGYTIDLFLLKINTKLFALFRFLYARIFNLTNRLKITQKRTSYLMKGNTFWPEFSGFMRMQNIKNF